LKEGSTAYAGIIEIFYKNARMAASRLDFKALNLQILKPKARLFHNGWKKGVARPGLATPGGVAV
jgi:hypothetical protein